MSAPAAPPGQELPSSRTSNALDCALSFLARWAGAARAASPVSYDPDDPLSVLRGDIYGRERAEAFLGKPFEYIGPDASAYHTIAERLRAGGHGAAALIVNGWPPHLGTGAHAWNACNYEGRLDWLDPNIAAQDDKPLYPEPYAVWAIFVDATTWNPPA